MENITDTELEAKYDGFYSLIGSYFSVHSVALIGRALQIADQKLAGMTRYDGTPLVMHSVNTAHIVFSPIVLVRHSTISSLLHFFFLFVMFPFLHSCSLFL